MRIILAVAFCVCFGGLCFAEDTKHEEIVAPENQMIPNFSELIEAAEKSKEKERKDKDTKPTEISITHEEQLSIENLQLKLQVLQGQLDSFVKGLVAKYHIDPQGWSYDPVGKFIKIKQPIKE